MRVKWNDACPYSFSVLNDENQGVMFSPIHLPYIIYYWLYRKTKIIFYLLSRGSDCRYS